jgi:hypothetical protein
VARLLGDQRQRDQAEVTLRQHPAAHHFAVAAKTAAHAAPKAAPATTLAAHAAAAPSIIIADTHDPFPF